MVSSRTGANKVRLLLNAEPFGFGPTAAIAALFPYVREPCSSLAYIGEGHTLDLQQGLAYDNIYDISGLTSLAKRQLMRKLAPHYDVFCTALDFSMATEARSAGMKIALYDPLTWYWKDIPPIVAQADLYAAQNFFGVKERLEAETDKCKNVHLIPPTVPTHNTKQERSRVLINLGGLQNPFWETEVAASYARLVIRAMREHFAADEELVIATSAQVAARLNDPLVRTYDRKAMLDILASSKYACMTPGLGNIYDVAGYNLPTLWLPPANDSQGQQLMLLQANDAADAVADWASFGIPAINYAASQPSVLQSITRAVHQLEHDPKIFAQFAATISYSLKKLATLHTSKSVKLVTTFGSNGAPELAKLVLALAR